MQKQELTPPVDKDRNALAIGVVETATAVALARLAKFSSMEQSKIRQTFLFAANRYCGIRLDAGPFHARWQFEDSTIQITRGRQIIDHIPFPDAISKAA